MPPSQVKGPIYLQHSELAAALASCRGAFLATGLISGISNVLMLTGAVFMLEIYDRVLPSRSVPTLIGIAILASGLYVVQGILDFIRSRVLVRIGGALDEAVSGRVFDTILRLPLKVAKVRSSHTGRARSPASIFCWCLSRGACRLSAPR